MRNFSDVCQHKEIVCKKCGEQFTATKQPGEELHEMCWPQTCMSCKRGGIRSCTMCAKQYVKTLGISYSRYCSEECRLRAHLLRGESKRILPRKTCRVCGRVTKTNDLCTTCAIEQKRAAKVPCEKCGELMRPRSMRHKYCRECAVLVERERVARYKRRKAERHTSAGSERAMRGQCGEFIFDLYCSSHGLPCARSIYETQPGWDRLIFLDNAWHRVQIKAFCASRQRQGKYDYSPTCYISGLPRAFGGCDMLAIVDVETTGVWLIPVSQMMTARTLALSDYEEFYSDAIP